MQANFGPPRPHLRPGFFCKYMMRCGILLLLATPASALRGQVRDDATGIALSGALLRVESLASALAPPSQTTYSDTGGVFSLQLPPGRWRLSIEHLGYTATRREITTPVDTLLAIRLEPRPLLMDEMVVQTRRTGDSAESPAFVERITIAKEGTAGIDLPRLLEKAVGVQIRRYGGLGSFSTVSIRGSTAEQVLVFLDGVPLNQAQGGGVDLGDLPLAGIESIDVYRGAVPARFGGNAIGGVVDIRTRAPGDKPHLRLSAGKGSFRTRQLGLSINGRHRAYRYSTLLDYGASENDFRFLDDNGTEYNANDDQHTRRRNSDFAGLRALSKIQRDWHGHRLQAYATFDLNHRGIPGISNNQSLHTRYDTRRQASQVELFGPLFATAGYRLKAYRLTQESEYKNLHGEVGAGTQHNRNTIGSHGVRAEINTLLPKSALLTSFAETRRQTFQPEDLLQSNQQQRKNRLGTEIEPPFQRIKRTLGSEVEVPLRRLSLIAGVQTERLDDRFRGPNASVYSQLTPEREKSQWLGSWRLGLRLKLGHGFALKGHRGHSQRPPSFQELFGNRGAVIGNIDLKNERGDNSDAGLVYRGTGILSLAEIAYYRNSVDDLIRFMHNSQSVSRALNVGRARLSGVETRLQTRPLAWARIDFNYTYQRAENRSGFAYERGNELPNAPRHALEARLNIEQGRHSAHYAFSRESRHYLDRANLRPVPRRLVHGLGGRIVLNTRTALNWEVRNLTDNQAADLWGYPLPGRALFLSIKHNLFTP